MPENTVVDPTERLKVQVISADPLIEAALKFYALRIGYTVEEYCTDSILVSLQGDEDQGDRTFDLRSNDGGKDRGGRMTGVYEQ